MGKSLLLDTVVAETDGFQTLRTSGLQVESKLPFAGLHQLLGPLLPKVASLPEAQREVLESVLAVRAPVAHHSFAVAAAVLALLALAADEQPVLLVVDDAHWLDPGSLEALLFAYRRLGEESLALVLACRTEAIPEALRTAALPELVLEPLDPAAALAVAAEHTGIAHDDPALDRIVRLGDGVPLALVELAELADAPDEPALGLGEFQGTVASLVERLFGRRVERLSPAAGTAALIAGLDEPTELDAFLRAGEALGVDAFAWEEAESASILRIDPGRVEFDHPLLREAVLASVSPAQRRRAHLALGDAMASRGDHDRAAWHRAEGTVGSDETIAAALEQAAENYRSRAGHLSAARALVRSARLSPTAAGRARRLLLAGDGARRAGRPAWAEALAAEARRASSDSLVHARAELLQAHIEARQGSMDTAFRRYERVAQQATPDDLDLAAFALSYAASAAIVIGDVPSALAAARQAQQIPARQLSEGTAVSVREAFAFVLALRGDTAQARPLLDAVADWYERQPRRTGAEYVAEAMMWLGDLRRVHGLLDDVVADARRLGAPVLVVHGLVLRADLGFRMGEWPAAIADATEAVSLAEDADQSIALAYALAILAILEAVTGAVDAARAHADRARDGARRHGLRVVEESASFALGAVELALGAPERALVTLEATAAAVGATGRGEPAVVLWPADHIEALIAVDRPDDASAAIDRLAAQAQATGGAWARGVVERYRGMLAAEVDYDAIFARAIGYHASSAMPFEHARTQLCYGQRLRRSGRRVEARTQLREALSTFESLRASPWQQRAERELTGSGEHLRRGPSTDRDQLTPQELQIARLIAAGATNREAAAGLFLSPKTIETHLTRIYRKLGLRSRSQLATVFAQSETS